MFKLEEKFKNRYGEDYFPYYVATLAAMMTYNGNNMLCNVISLKENEFLARVVKSIVPLPDIKYNLYSKFENKLIYTIRIIGYSPYKITSFDINAEIALKHKKVFAYNNYELFDKNKNLIFIDKKPTLVLSLEDKEFNIDYNFRDIEIICME